jgi:hypothetical protein
MRNDFPHDLAAPPAPRVAPAITLGTLYHLSIGPFGTGMAGVVPACQPGVGPGL